MKRKAIKTIGKRKGGSGGEEGGSKLRRSKTVEQTYQKKTPVEHILLRPDTYVGSIEKQDDLLWVWNKDKGEMEQKNISYVPALYKIFDEILVNAADNLQRCSKMTCIKVDIDAKQGRIKVLNNGRGLPIQIHKEHKVYVPELVFGHLLTSDNYDDSEKKVTGGRNGFGAKLTNIFSNKFIVQTSSKGKVYTQTWTTNMQRKGKPEIKRHSGEDFTSIEFWPDLTRFGMKELEADVLGLMRRRVFDLSGTSGVRCNVHLDGKQMKEKSFQDYAGLFHSADTFAYYKSKRWELLVARSDGDGFQQNSFVNAISTPKGGTHVQYILDQLADAIMAKASKQAGKGSEIKKVHVRNHLWIFINSLIENPAFSSQTKEQMTLKASSFGSACDLPKSFITEVMEKTNIVDAVVAEASAKMTAQMDSKVKGGRGKRVLGIPKLEDANEAGGKNSEQCTLILTEGDSAKALAVAGLAVVGRDRFGVFPLRGKLLNVREAAQRQVMENKEIMNLVKILGLKFDSSVSKANLRYGSVMVMADQDHDGSHIKGLLVNLFHHWWPDLLKNQGFLKEFVTPIVKVSKGESVTQFFTQTEYEQWKEKNNKGQGWKTKYYKGLGTSTAAEAKQYFNAIDLHRLDFDWASKKSGELIDMAFNKNRADDRKVWMNSYEEGTCVDHTKEKVSYEDFINLELVQFARYDVMRSVPNVMDGLKPAQRKILFCCFKRNLRSDVKVAQLVGYVAEHGAYHHGETSLGGAIVTMAQDYVGSNNVNLLVPSGQFGTRMQGGKDHASTRYIFTRLQPVTRLIFAPSDDAILQYQEEDGQRIEPHWYAPVIPMVLVNGAQGIGTGWSTDVPNYDPREIIANLKLFIKKKKMKTMRPWYRGFSGKIKPAGKGRYECFGVSHETDKGVEITELPLKKWTQDYKEFLQGMLPGSEKSSKMQIKDMREYHTENKVHFVLKMEDDMAKKAKEDGHDNTFKLTSSISETNMVLFDHEGRIKKYKNVLEIMQEFAEVRMKMYDVRKKYLIEKLTLEKDLLYNRARFIGMIIAKKLHVNNRKKAEVCNDLTRFKFSKFGDTTPPRTGFEYLLIMQIASLTKERKEELERMLREKAKELEILKKTTIAQLWEGDLGRLEAAIDEIFAKLEAEEASGAKGKKRKSSSRSKSRGRDKKKGAQEDEKDAGEGEGEEAAAVDPMDTPFDDISKWTSGLLKGPSATIGPGAKKRRLK